MAVLVLEEQAREGDANLGVPSLIVLGDRHVPVGVPVGVHGSLGVVRHRDIGSEPRRGRDEAHGVLLIVRGVQVDGAAVVHKATLVAQE